MFQSSVGAEKRHGAGQIDGLARTEEALDATGASVLHLRCGFFFTKLLLQLDALRDGVLPGTWPTHFAMPWVDPRDIGDVAAARLLSDGWSGPQVQAVHGPENLTFDEVAEILTETLGREIRAVRVPDDEVRAELRAAGLSDGQVDGVLGMSIGLRERFVPEDARSVVTTTPTTLASWAQARLRPLF